ncbi:MAG: hypothetical protein ABIR11_09610, partial [Candidatus Limnocylindrales bacterium]
MQSRPDVHEEVSHVACPSCLCSTTRAPASGLAYPCVDALSVPAGALMTETAIPEIGDSHAEL